MSWIRLDNGTRVNMDHVETVEFREPVDAIGLTHHRVLFYPPGDIDPIIACEGSEQKCKRFLADLDSSLNPVFIQAYEVVKCPCECGCDTNIPEGFKLCEDCEFGYHIGENGRRKFRLEEDFAEFKKDAA